MKIKYIILGLVLPVILYFSYQFGYKFVKSKQTFEKVIIPTIKESNKTLPMELDQVTMLDSIVATKDSTINYFYSLKVNKSEIDINVTKQTLSEQILKSFKSSETFALHKEYKTKMIYNYFDIKNDYLFSIELDKNIYNE